DVDISFSLGRVCIGTIELLGVSIESSSEGYRWVYRWVEISGGEGYVSPRCLET
ncbi:hypothetical protein A2U01_0070719, partial [Trifolium medium]|nr:hypothetical protein [Trifolium medium]